MRIFLFFLMFAVYLSAGIGEVTALKGKADIQRGSRTISAKVGSTIEKGDIFLTRGDAKAQIRLNDNTVVTLGKDSRYIFGDYRMAGKNSRMNMELKNGYFRIITGKIGKLAPNRFKVKTAHATIGIRGTDFYDYSGKKYEEAGCIRGVISVNTGEKTYILYPGERVIFKNSKWRLVKKDQKRAAEEKSVSETVSRELQKDHVVNQSRISTHVTPYTGPSLSYGPPQPQHVLSPLWH